MRCHRGNVLSGILWMAVLASVWPEPQACAVTPPVLLNDVVDVSGDFQDIANIYFVADSLAFFDPDTRSGTVLWRPHMYVSNLGFNNTRNKLQRTDNLPALPQRQYKEIPLLPFSVDFVSPRTVRIRMQTKPTDHALQESLMLAGGRVSRDDSAWQFEQIQDGIRYRSACGSVTFRRFPWRMEFYDAQDRLLTATCHTEEGRNTINALMPFCFVRRASDFSQSIDAVFSLTPDEKLFGCGESFTRLDKRGQKVVLWANDAAVGNTRMYKPIPFFLSSRGYGMFLHTSTPVTFDFGATHDGRNAVMTGDDVLDLFFFFGSPKEILDAYTTVTGKSPLPPLWSFGLWISRNTYTSEQEVLEVSSKFRQYKIPGDVLHLDTGWFTTKWICDFQFDPVRFPDPERMTATLKRDGFRLSLWQYSYLVPENLRYREVVEQGLVIRDRSGNLPYADAIVDFSNPAAVQWYQQQLARLLRMGVSGFKVDFGEAAPLTGMYHSGSTGFYEHNLYPLRYNKAAAEITREITGDNIIFARSAWAGSQRYPLHWSGDPAPTDVEMAATLRGGLSLGLCGFSFWSHDMGGYMRTHEEIYRRWTPFGMLTSHSRNHGVPPTEPWEFSDRFVDDFRRACELKYRLMPYVYAQAKDCTERGLPMVRALFVEFPDDPGSWLIEDQYLFGRDLLVAPLFDTDRNRRAVYCPPGRWIDYQTGTPYAGGWHHIEAGVIPIILLVREGAVIPHIKLAQSTAFMDWSALDLVVFADEAAIARGQVFLPSDTSLHDVTLKRSGKSFHLQSDPLKGAARLTVIPYGEFQRGKAQ